MNGKWIDQFPEKHEYDLELDEESFELQMADAEVAQDAAARAEAAATIVTEKAASVTEKTDIVIEKAETAIQKAAEAGRYSNSCVVSVRVIEQIKNETVQASNSATMAKNDTQIIKEDVERAIINIDNKISAAETSAQNAATSETSAQTYSTQANNSALAAAQSVQLANNVLTEVEENALEAAQSATEAATSATNAESSASEANQFAENASLSEQAAKISEQQAAESKNNAADSASSAASAKNDAITAATNASNSALSANTAKTEVQSLKNNVDTTVNNFTSTTVPNAIQQINSISDTCISNIEEKESEFLAKIPDLQKIATIDDIPSVPVQDVQINGTSILSNNVANIPIADASTLGAIMVGTGLTTANNKLVVAGATAAEIKAGNSENKPISTYRQHEATFYGLAKAAGIDEKNSTLSIGQYTEEAKSAIQNMFNVSDKSKVETLSALPIISPPNVEMLLNNGEYTNEAKIALQKALGIYEAPWELIREDTFTNETEADHIINTDSNGQSLALTDYFLYFETPVQDTYSKKGSYGQVWIYYNNITTAVSRPESGAWEQNAGTSGHGFAVYGEQKNGLFLVHFTSQTTTSNRMSWNLRYSRFGDMTSQVQSGVWIVKDFLRTYNLSDTSCFAHRIDIKAVTGTGHYKLYGRRKQ